MLNINNEMSKSTIQFITIQINLLFFMCVCFYSSFVCISAYANVYFKTIIIKQNIKIILIAGVPSSQALPGFLITAPPTVCVPDVIGALARGFQTQKKKTTYLECGCISFYFSLFFFAQTRVGGFQRPWDHNIQEILPSLNTFTNEAGRTLAKRRSC